MKLLLPLALFSLLFFSLSCGRSAQSVRAVSLSPTAQSVRVIKQYPAGCAPAGRVQGWGVARANGTTVWNYAMNDMRNKAAAAGYDTVVLQRYKHSDDGNYLSVKVFGRLMRCARRGGAKRPRGIRKGGTPRRRNGQKNRGYGAVQPTPPPSRPGQGVGQPEPTSPGNSTTPPPPSTSDAEASF